MLKEAAVCCGWNLYALRKNPRFYMSLLLGFLLCWLLTDKTMAISRQYLTDVQIFEPFVWCYADDDSILYASLVMLLMLSAFPKLDASASYLIFRARRSSWLMGQLLTVLVLTALYCGMILLSSMGLCLGHAFFEDRWSETATMLSFAPGSFEVALTVLRKTVKLTTPYTCCVQIFLLLFQYVLLLATIQLAFTLLKSRRTGIMAALILNFAGFVLTPDRFMTWMQLPNELQYYANLVSAWLSPLQHATYVMHNFGYDLLPKLWVSYLMLGGATAALILASALAIRRYPFHFAGGNCDE